MLRSLVEPTGISLRELCRYNNGRAMPMPEQVARLAVVLGVPASVIRAVLEAP